MKLVYYSAAFSIGNFAAFVALSVLFLAGWIPSHAATVLPIITCCLLGTAGLVFSIYFWYEQESEQLQTSRAFPQTFESTWQ